MIKPSQINVLIACEESQAECIAFRAFDFNAYSCDIQKARYNPKHHIMGDVTPYLNGRAWFKTQDGKRHRLSKWHLIVAHPPCTYLCKVSSVQLWKNGEIDPIRLHKMELAADFFRRCLQAKADFVAVENQLPMKRAGLPKPSCFIQPSWYGVKYTKRTLYWLRNLPPLLPTLIYPNPKCFVTASRGKYRSRTFPQVAQAMAEQWGKYILNKYNR